MAFYPMASLPASTQQLAITAFGEANTLHIQTSALSEPQDNQVMVAVDFSSVNPIDAKTRAGLGWAAAQNKENLPWVPGYDIAGHVVAIGDNVTHLVVGERVSGFIGFPLQAGAYSQYVNVEAADLSILPDNVSLQVAASLPLAGQTAWQALEKVKVKASDRVLILAGAGGVGHIAVQLAVALQATVFATGSADNKAFIEQLGATAIDYRCGEIANQIEPVDILIDLMGGDVGMAALMSVRSGGRVVTIPTMTAEQVCQQAQSLGLEATGMLVSPTVEQNNTMLEMVAKGQLNVEVAAIYPLADGDKAHQQIESGRTRGKILLAVSNA
ncbi:NADP-dependent oxidoreductase [Photobacterium sanguinicancri]|uniref:NADP-dependent oxidoreductase n=1 Tax=Photobacterium sanguinicancri TaxID=875932 RepID=UPI003D0DF572